ncbi:MAG: DUF1800 domain-containing protein [Actinobacteria bacterium]|nr:DUF1800 domain-containing protein [Actinomycetota bacterium]
MAELLTRHDVASILGRAAFGATAADLDLWTGKTQDELAAHLLAVPTDSSGFQVQPDEPRRLAVTAAATSAGRQNGGAQLQAAQGWWLERMRTTTAPLHERMTLLWHDHFATAHSPMLPNTATLVLQNQTLRAGALGSFRGLLANVTTDPAMLYWLDGARSVTGKPNENYAREFLELFTMGVSPQQFTEGDIREAARAFTGWIVNGQRAAAFDQRRHDPGDKTFLGRRIPNLGKTEHLAIRDAALQTPVSSRFLAWKLVQKFAYDPGPIDLMTDADPLVARVASTLRQGWNIRDAVEVMLRAPEFRRRPQPVARQPVEQAVHACKVLGVPADAAPVIQALDVMGQRLFAPPNVGGWPVDEEWLAPGTTLARYRLATFVETEARRRSAMVELPVGPQALPESADLAAWAARFGLAGFSANTERTLRGYLAAAAGAPEAQRQKGVMTLVISSPDWTVM